VSEKYAGLGLPNFPEGIPFTFWEQYVRLSHNLLVCLCLITAAVFIVITLLLMSPWTAAIIVSSWRWRIDQSTQQRFDEFFFQASVLVMVVVELGGFMGIIGLKLNPVSAVTLITAVGIGVEFTVHVCFVSGRSIEFSRATPDLPPGRIKFNLGVAAIHTVWR